MNGSFFRSIFTATLYISSAAWAHHPVETLIMVDRKPANMVRLSQVQLRHDNDGQYVLTGKVRRQLNFPVTQGHIDLLVFNDQGDVMYEDTQYYWPRIVNRRYRHPSRFKFTIPKNVVNEAAFRLSFHKNTFSSKTKLTH